MTGLVLAIALTTPGQFFQHRTKMKVVEYGPQQSVFVPQLFTPQTYFFRQSVEYVPAGYISTQPRFPEPTIEYVPQTSTRFVPRISVDYVPETRTQYVPRMIPQGSVLIPGN